MRKVVYIFFIFSFLVIGKSVFASTLNIVSSPNDHWAWNDVVGWIEFYYDDVEVGPNRLSGYALLGTTSSTSTLGILSLNCDETGNPDGTNYCAISDYYVKNDGDGNLSGWAWNENIGWISFSCKDDTGVTDYDVCATSNYKVWIERGDDDLGHFRGWAWNDLVGWICFNCKEIENYLGDSNYCENTSDFEVVSEWAPWLGYATSGQLLSLIIDTEETKTTLTGIVWKGEVPTDCDVKFWLGSSDTTNPSDFQWSGPYGFSSWVKNPGWYEVNIPPADLENHNKHRYLRYKVVLESDASHINSPKIEKIVLQWME